jgi:predicted DNA-binding transcriptional regulator AlpA
MEKRLLTSKEAAAYIGVAESYLRQVRMTGQIGGRMVPPPHIEMGRSIRYDKVDLDNWIDALPKRFAISEEAI